MRIFSFSHIIFLDFFFFFLAPISQGRIMIFVFLFFSINHSYVGSKWRQKNYLVSFAFLSLSRDILNTKHISVHVEQKKPCQHFYSVSKKGLDSQGTYVSSQNYNCSWIMQFSYLLPTFLLPQFLFIRFMIWFLLHNGLQLSHIGLRHVSRPCHITWFAL